jgi:hypothetical protein
MRGGSQSWLVRGVDGCFYIAKFVGNPQGNRTLINEWIACRILSALGVSTPKLCILEIPLLLHGRERLRFVTSKTVLVEGTIHLGSPCPINPEQAPIFDYLPIRLISKIVNLHEFATIFIFDKWVAQTDMRQAVFVRDQTVAVGVGFRAHFIDHGMSFGGALWTLSHGPLQGLPMDYKAIYSTPAFKNQISESLELIESITEATLRNSADGVPSSWHGQRDHEELAILYTKLAGRLRTIRPIVTEHLKSII